MHVAGGREYGPIFANFLPYGITPLLIDWLEILVLDLQFQVPVLGTATIQSP